MGMGKGGPKFKELREIDIIFIYNRSQYDVIGDMK